MPELRTGGGLKRVGRTGFRLAMTAAAGLFEIVRRNQWVHGFAYDLRNRRQFTDLYVHEQMLADHSRVNAYQAAIARHVQPETVVVELGSGSGILSFFAARQGASVVHAIDHSEVVEVARQVAAANDLDVIEFHRCHSREFSLPEPANVLIQEQIGDWLFNENMVANVTDLRDRVLAPDGIILPARFEVYLEPVQLTDAARVPFIWEQDIHGVSFAALKPRSDQDVRDSFAYRSEAHWAEHYECLLSDPEPALTFDLMTINPEDLPQRLQVQRTIARAGRMDGFCLYFVARFDDTISFSNSPEAPRTHWLIPLLRTPARPVEVGDVVALDLSMPEIAVPTSWRWTMS